MVTKNKLIFFLIGLMLFTFVSADWTIEGDSVYMNDSNIYINVTPHTSNNPVIEFMTKDFSGNIDVVFGFDKDTTQPQGLKRYISTSFETVSYTCDGEFTYTTNPQYFECYESSEVFNNVTNETDTVWTLVFGHSYETGNIPLKTAYWTEYTDNYNDISGSFSKITREFQGFDTWYYKQGFSITEDTLYKVKLDFLKTDPWSSDKYYFGIKPSLETLSQAINNGHFYYLDPWTMSLNTGLTHYYRLDNSDLTNIFGVQNLSGEGDMPTNVTGQILSGQYGDGTGDYLSGLTDWDEKVDTVSLWFKEDNSVSCYLIGASKTNDIRYIIFFDDGHLTYNRGLGTAYTITTANGLVADNAWHHILFEEDSTDGASIWVDGVNVGNDSNVMDWSAHDDAIIPDILARNNNGVHGGTPCIGTIDELVIWNRSLTDTEIISIANSDEGYQEEASEDTANPTISSLLITALNSSEMPNGLYYNTSNLEEIEYTQINFTVSDATNVTDDFILYFTANGTNSCSLGNLQSNDCYNYTGNTWIEYQIDTTTSTFKNEGNVGDYIDCSYVWASGTSKDFSCLIDEHYNPNVFKWYNAGYNFSALKWQNVSNNGLITKTDYIIVEFPEGNVPLDADQYKLDFRVDTIGGSTAHLSAYGCSSSYTTGNPLTDANCLLIASKTPSEFQDDGTKFRAIFTKDLVDALGNGKYIVLTSDEPNPAKGFAIKTYNITNSSHTQMWRYSTDSGTTWASTGDGYETEMNINWFYNGNSPTELIFKIWTNDTLGNNGNSSEYNLTWDIDATQNYPPLVNIITPQGGDEIDGVYSFTWDTAEPNSNFYYTNVSLTNITDTYLISGLIANNTQSYSFNTSTFLDGTYNLFVESCETLTTDKFCGNDTHYSIVISNAVSESGSGTGSSLCTYRNFRYYNSNIPFLREDGCL